MRLLPFPSGVCARESSLLCGGGVTISNPTTDETARALSIPHCPFREVLSPSSWPGKGGKAEAFPGFLLLEVFGTAGAATLGRLLLYCWQKTLGCLPLVGALPPCLFSSLTPSCWLAGSPWLSHLVLGVDVAGTALPFGGRVGVSVRGDRECLVVAASLPRPLPRRLLWVGALAASFVPALSPAPQPVDRAVGGIQSHHLVHQD